MVLPQTKYVCNIVGEVLLTAIPARPTSVWTLKGGNPVSAPGVGGNCPWKTSWIVAHTLKGPSGLVCLANCIHKFKKNKKYAANKTDKLEGANC